MYYSGIVGHWWARCPGCGTVWLANEASCCPSSTCEDRLLRDLDELEEVAMRLGGVKAVEALPAQESGVTRTKSAHKRSRNVVATADDKQAWVQQRKRRLRLQIDDVVCDAFMYADLLPDEARKLAGRLLRVADAIDRRRLPK